jgi:hypothetical protein
MAELPAEIRAYYEAGEEQRRLENGPFKLERARTEEILLIPTAARMSCSSWDLSIT